MSPRHCAGCGQPIGEFDFVETVDGFVVHEGCTPGAHGTARA